MKPISLLLLRIATGLLLVLWGIVKTMAPAAAIHVSDKFYHGALSNPLLQRPLGIAEIILGALTVFGIFRRVVLPLQALVLGIGLIAIWRFVLDPFGLYFVSPESREPLFFPSLAVFFGAIAQIAFREDDRIALDRVVRKS